ncbi:MAG: hypothetical protein ACI9Y1_003651 [Lentisphaeria bacterium]|jgi:hypothetical protein
MNIKHITCIAIFATLAFSGQNYAADSTRTETVKQQPRASQLPVHRDAASGQPTGKRQHKPMTIKKRIDKASPLLSNGNGGSSVKAGYRLCPDGNTMVSHGEKCPEKASRSSYRLCPDGTRINPGEKCPEKSNRR